MKKGIRVLLCALLILVLGIAPAMAEGVGAWINNSSAPIYTSSGDKGTLSAGTSVKVIAAKNGWCRISCNGHVGYIKTKFLTAKEGVVGYVKTRAYVYKSASKSSQKIGPLGVGTELMVVGSNGNFYQVTNGHAVGYIAKSVMSHSKPSSVKILASKVQPITWNKGKNLVARGQYASLYDIESGLIVRVRRLGGSQHMELEPATAEDTEKLLKMSGGKFSWDSRPVILHAGGKYVAAAINTMPHGEQTITDNNFDGQFCLHMIGSKTHGTEKVNVNHQAAIKAALTWAKTKAK